MPTKVTIQDIADSLGLSRTTVSKVLNHSHAATVLLRFNIEETGSSFQTARFCIPFYSPGIRSVIFVNSTSMCSAAISFSIALTHSLCRLLGIYHFIRILFMCQLFLLPRKIFASIDNKQSGKSILISSAVQLQSPENLLVYIHKLCQLYL